MRLPIVKKAVTQKLDPTGIHPTAMEGTSPETAWFGVYGDDEGREAGIWECSEGKYRLERKSDEFCYILQGHWKLTGADGDEYEVKAGDVLYLRKGWCGTSHIIEKIRKVYMAA